MKKYSIMPNDWDYSCEQEVKTLQSKGVYLPCMLGELAAHCGSLYPYITTKRDAIAYVKDLKAKYPFVVFDLMVGESWGTLELVKSF